MPAEIFAKKNPLIAGVLSIIPGMGQFYNEQIGKGIFILGMFFFSLLIFIVGPMPFMFPAAFGWDGIGLNHRSFPFRPFFLPADPEFYSRLYPVLWVFLILPMLVIYSVVDAMVTAKKMQQVPPGVSPTAPPAPEAPNPTNPIDQFSQEQEVLRMQSQEKMSGPSNSTPGSTPGTSCDAAQKHSVKLLLGLILMGIGFIYFFELWEYRFFDFDHLWPLIPLIFGLRMLTDFLRDRDQGQLILGMMFTGVGGIFFAENWLHIRLWRWISYNWPAAIILLGCILVIQDYAERKKRINR